MFDSAIIEVAIGLAFIYVLLSVVCTALSELIAQMLATRAATLEKWVRQVLAKPEDLRKFYEHSLVKALAGPDLNYESVPPDARALWRKLGDWRKIRDWTRGFIPRVKQAHRLPSYMPARTFATAALEKYLHEDGGLRDEDAPPFLKDAIAEARREAKRALAVTTALSEVAATDKDKVLATPEYIKASIEAARDEVERARRIVEAWYDDAMQRVTGWYKRNAQVIIVILALAVAGTLNADSIAIARVLWRDGTVRATLVAQAVPVSQGVAPAGAEGDQGTPEPTTTPTETAVGEDEGNGGLAATPNEAGEDEPNAVEPTATPAGVPLDVEGAQKQLSKLNVPLFWGGNLPDSGGEVTSKIAGLVMTAAALSLGAPFWFDMLGKLVNLRGTGKLPKAEGEQPASGG
ncbi:MAG: hypothetical protein WEE64_06155 [Dehalococcoidia bacterium]